MMVNMSSLDSQLYEWWLFEEAALERDKRSIDICSHRKRIQLIILDLWTHATQFVIGTFSISITSRFFNLDYLYRLAIN